MRSTPADSACSSLANKDLPDRYDSLLHRADSWTRSWNLNASSPPMQKSSCESSQFSTVSDPFNFTDFLDLDMRS